MTRAPNLLMLLVSVALATLLAHIHPSRAAVVELPIGFILPLSTQIEIGEDIIAGLVVAKQNIDEWKLLPDGVQFLFNPESKTYRDDYILDDESRTLVGLRHATSLVLQKDVCVLMGAWNSAVSVQVATYAASVGMVQISGASVSPLLSQKRNYPSFLRPVPNSDMTMQFQLKLCQELGWKDVAVICTDDGRCAVC